MGMEAVGGLMVLVSAVAAVAMLFAVVFMRIVNGYLVDRTLGCGEALALTGLLLGVLVMTYFAWGTLFMLVPPVVGLAGWLIYGRTLGQAERLGEQQHYAAEEERARALIARDPTALIGYERLAEALEHRGALPEALATYEELVQRAPLKGDYQRRADRLKARLQQERPAGPSA